MSTVFLFFLILVPLVVVHELGHFIMAKLGGINVTQFAFGFGKKLFGFHYKGTEYRWNLLPLGGYVDFMGEILYTNRIPDDVTHFYNRPKWIRFLVLIMGPMFNLILALLLYWFIFASKPIEDRVYYGEGYTVGYVVPGSVEDKAGLQRDDLILSVNGKPVTDVEQLEDFIMFSPKKEVNLEVKRDGRLRTVTYTIPENKEGLGPRSFQAAQRTMIYAVSAGSPAENAGLKPFDVITHINGEPVINAQLDINRLIQQRAPEATVFQLRRKGELVTIEAVPEKLPTGRYQVGFRYSPVMAISGIVPGSSAEKAGIRENDILISINGQNTLKEIMEQTHSQDATPWEVTVKQGPETLQVTLTPAQGEDGLWHPGMSVQHEYMISDIVPDSPADRAGLKPYDVILGLNGHPAVTEYTISNYLERQTQPSRAGPETSDETVPATETATADPETMPPTEEGETGTTTAPASVTDEASALALTVVRGEETLTVDVQPEATAYGYSRIGIYEIGEYQVRNLNWHEAFFEAWARFKKDSTYIYDALRRLVTAQLSIKTLSGPVGIAQVARQAYEYGIHTFLLVMALISLNLGIMNLLPIPVLDGGEIFVLAVEWITRKDFSLDTKMRIKLVGFVFLVGLMATVIVMDVIKVFT